MIKLIATDMDGSLLNDDHKIDDEFWEVFKEIRKKNIIFSAASGRQYYNLLEKFDSIKDDMLFIAENGTYVVKNGIEFFSVTIDKKDAIELIEIGRGIEGAHIVICGKKSAYIENSDEKLVSEVSRYYSRFEVVEDVTKIEDDILKITLCDFKGSEENSHKHFINYEDKFNIAVSGKLWLDIIHNKANKGAAIKKIQEFFQITPCETMVFGDYLNDLEMVKNAKYSFAMENAHPLLKKEANFIAETNNQNGVVKKIKEILL
ncbi:Cof-type HAD-IIB family hydrolase [Ilyobacter polytropus]|uniref:Cof-like hydrolase n=1 Tax=Ilyobacter polytropus (strain ATCC 51220 / DSM 2926 / LMG 16218 / CuHBu1) TaxID=572544 RepID=E3H7R1_ILYPC|nr:Cof-type HAD-IIB family hydrolase [Ilyobacter polytropus]ADO82643.1 Cof-like hydrolase [Ilyobacter polytropus DSM 2926]